MTLSDLQREANRYQGQPCADKKTQRPATSVAIQTLRFSDALGRAKGTSTDSGMSCPGQWFPTNLDDVRLTLLGTSLPGLHMARDQRLFWIDVRAIDLYHVLFFQLTLRRFLRDFSCLNGSECGVPPA